MSGKSTKRLHMPPARIPFSHVLPISKEMVEAKLFSELANDPKRQKEVATQIRIMDSICYHQSETDFEQMKTDFTTLHPGYHSKHLNTQVSDAAEVEAGFMKQFMTLMREAHFSPLSQHELDEIGDYRYLFFLPITVQVDMLAPLDAYTHYLSDSHYFPGLHERHALPALANRFMVFHRGVNVDRRCDYFFWPKLDILLQVGQDWLVSRIRNLFQKQDDTSAASKRNAIPDVKEYYKREIATQHHRHKPLFVERINLLETFYRSSNVVTWFFSKVTIQEPTFERVVVLYRESLHKHKISLLSIATETDEEDPSIVSFEDVEEEQDNIADATPAPTQATKQTDVKTSTEKSEPSKENTRGVMHLKYFRDVPVADVAVIYPEKDVSMDAVDKLKLFASLILGFIALAYQLASDDSQGSAGTLSSYAIIVGLVGYAVQSYISFQGALDNYATLVHETLYEKSLDHEMGVLVVLTDTKSEQVALEISLAYHFLSKIGPCTATTLQEAIEAWIYDKWRVRFSFAVHDALTKLTRLDLIAVKAGKAISARPAVEQDEDDAEVINDDDPEFRDRSHEQLYSALPSDNAITKLREEWSDIFEKKLLM